jgi:tetratricopeptide (TPR) repeat protein
MDEQAIIPNASAKNAAQWTDEGNLLYESRRYEEALAAFERAIQLDPGNTVAQCGKASSLNCLGRYEQALKAYTCAI